MKTALLRQSLTVMSFMLSFAIVSVGCGKKTGDDAPAPQAPAAAEAPAPQAAKPADAPSALDQALIDAQADRNKRPDFYNTFFRTQIYVASLSAPDQEASGKFQPAVVENNGKQYIMLFDSAERLATWSNQRLGSRAMPGQALVQALPPNFHWMLNVGTPYAKEFVPEEINWLKSQIANATAAQGAGVDKPPV